MVCALSHSLATKGAAFLLFADALEEKITEFKKWAAETHFSFAEHSLKIPGVGPGKGFNILRALDVIDALRVVISEACDASGRDPSTLTLEDGFTFAANNTIEVNGRPVYVKCFDTEYKVAVNPDQACACRKKTKKELSSLL